MKPLTPHDLDLTPVKTASVHAVIEEVNRLLQNKLEELRHYREVTIVWPETTGGLSVTWDTITSVVESFRSSGWLVEPVIVGRGTRARHTFSPKEN